MKIEEPFCSKHTSNSFDINDTYLEKKIKKLHHSQEITLISSFHESYHDVACRIADILCVPFHYNRNTIDLVDNKFKFREFLRSHDIDPTVSIKIKDLDDIKAFSKNIGFPIVIKPIDGVGSLGVSMLSSLDDVDEAINWLKEKAPHTSIIAEEFITGKEYSLEAFSEKGIHSVICVTEKFKETKHFVGLGHRIPAKVDSIQLEKITKVIFKALTKLGVMNGPTHTEFILNDIDVRIVETHIRIPGARIIDLIYEMFGLDVINMWVRQVCGHSIKDNLQCLKPKFESISIRFGFPKNTGYIKSVNNMDIANKLPNIIGVGMLKKIGDFVEFPIRDSTGRAVYAIATGKSHTESLTSADKALSLLEYNLTDYE